MKITAVRVKDFKRIRDITIAPDVDRALILIGGANAQGKSSLLDGLTAAFGGKGAMPVDPVRHGAEQAEIRVELDGGALAIRRVVTAAGEHTLEVRDASGAVKKPQALLDQIIGARFLDPLAFLMLDAQNTAAGAAKQRAALLQLLPDAAALDGLAARRKEAFDQRTEIGRDLKKAEGELARLPIVDTSIASIDVSDVNEQLIKANAILRDHSALADKIGAARLRYRQAATDIERLETELLAARARLDAALAEGNSASEAQKTLPSKEDAQARIVDLTNDLRDSAEHNRKIAVNEAAEFRRRDAEAEIVLLGKRRDALTTAIEEIDAAKAAMLEAAKLPVPGLGVSDDAVTLEGIPLAQASGAERLRVALALAVAASPKLQDVWVRDGSLLDDESLALVAKLAEASGVRCWVERVGDRDPGAIVIVDGEATKPRRKT